MNGIQSILDFILSLLGSLLDLLGTFLDSVLKVLERITDMGSGFGDFIKAAFSFLPAECYDLIFLTIAAICAVGLIKMIKG